MSFVGCFWVSGPDCTDGLARNWNLCVNLVAGNDTSGTNLGIAECVLQHMTEIEKAVMNQWQFLLTLCPAFVGVFCSFGPDPSDFVYDNVWWAVLFAATCGGLPGLDTNKPRHYCKVDDAREGHLMCQFLSGEPDPKHPDAVPRSFGRPDRSKIEAVVRIEWTGYIFSWSIYVIFNAFLAIALKKAASWATTGVPEGAGVWYWISAGPALLTVLSEAVQNRVDLYEQVTGYQPMESMSVMVSDNNTIDNSKQARSGSARELHEPMPQPRRFYRCEKQSFVSTWRRIIWLQWTRTPYRLLVNVEDDRWGYMLWKVFANTIRVAIFVWGSSAMGAVFLMPFHYVLVLTCLIPAATAVPRLLFYGVWRSKTRGADLVVVCDRFALGTDSS